MSKKIRRPRRTAQILGDATRRVAIYIRRSTDEDHQPFSLEAQETKLRAFVASQPGEWQIISGGLEAAETVLDRVLREVREEAGPQVQVRPLGVVHAHTFHFDDHVPYMIGIYYLLVYEGGEVQPGDDMRDAHYRWWSLEELTAANVRFHASIVLSTMP